MTDTIRVEVIMRKRPVESVQFIQTQRGLYSTCRFSNNKRDPTEFVLFYKL